MSSVKILLLVVGVCFTICSCQNQDTCRNDDPFIHGEVIDGKEFLYPWDPNQRNGDWYHNQGFCRKYCAQMVEILSEEENDKFHRFIREVGVEHPGVWLGAQTRDADKSIKWKNYATKDASYTNFQSGEPNERGLTCIHAAWEKNDKNPWWNYNCNTKTFHIACERYVNTGPAPQPIDVRHGLTNTSSWFTEDF